MYDGRGFAAHAQESQSSAMKHAEGGAIFAAKCVLLEEGEVFATALVEVAEIDERLSEADLRFTSLRTGGSIPAHQ